MARTLTKALKARKPAAAKKPARTPATKSKTAKSRSRVVKMRGSYDAAQTTTENENHWKNADSLSADALNDPSVRQILRDRARYERRNNGSLNGMIETLAIDLVGTGPRLQLTIPGADRTIAQQIENSFANWAEAADLAEDLRLMHKTKVCDGECFGLLVDNPQLPATGRTPITLDLALYEAEQVADPFHYGFDPLYVDGIRRDRFGNPTHYSFLDTHPGGIAAFISPKPRAFDAAQVIHWFTKDRPGQTRGVTAIAPGLPLVSQLRRFGLAVLGSAEIAAMIAGVLESDAPPGEADEDDIEAMDAIDFVRNKLLTLPSGWKANQFESKNPPPGYKEFRGEVLSEVGRPSLVPRNIMTGDSSPYNFSSSRLDFVIYHRMIRVERSRIRNRVLDRLFCHWVQEAALAAAIPPALPPLHTWKWEWHWPGFESIDPKLDAETDEIELRNGTTTLASIFARKGQDWEEQLRQQARERALKQELGLDKTGTLPAAKQPQPEPANA